MRENTRRFTLAEQEAFAALSGDWNPWHIDPIQARRSPFGRPVVHGIHLLLWALEKGLKGDAPASLQRLSCTFRHTIGIDDPVTCQWIGEQDGVQQLRLFCLGRECVALSVALGAARTPFHCEDRPVARQDCRPIEETELEGRFGTLPLEVDAHLLGVVFPRLVLRLGVAPLALLLSLTRLIGMECPGLHSIFGGLQMEAKEDSSDAVPGEMTWKVTQYDSRFRRLSLQVGGGNLAGTVTAFLRLPPQTQPGMDQIRQWGEPRNCRDRRVLVIGGSRGLGELCAKLAAAGGADVRLSYHRGAADALRVVREIEDAGGRAKAFLYDVLASSVRLKDDLGRQWVPTHVYYFPSPPIFVSVRGFFSADLFHHFCRYYVHGFYALWERLREAAPRRPLTLFYPSSVAVETTPAGMLEYAAAKAAGEVVCRTLGGSDPDLTVQCVRLPRLPSDQTLTLFPEETQDAYGLLREILECSGAGAAEQGIF